MERRPFSQVLQNAGFDLRKEYDRLFYLFYGRTGPYDSVAQQIDSQFGNYLPRKTCLSLSDFDESYGFHFEQRPADLDLNYLVNFCEYCYNLCIYFRFFGITSHIERIIEMIHYKMLQDESGFYLFVEDNPVAMSVSEIVSQKLSIETLRYSHHGLKGDLVQKQKILKDMADYLEPLEGSLAGIDSALKKNLFYLFNNCYEGTPCQAAEAPKKAFWFCVNCQQSKSRSGGICRESEGTDSGLSHSVIRGLDTDRLMTTP